MILKSKFKTIVLAAISAIFLFASSFIAPVFADEGGESPSIAIQVSPMNQKITLNPGERYYGTFKVTNPGSSKYSFHYKTEVEPFYVDESYGPIYENNGDYNQIVNWITVIDDNAIITPNNTTIVRFYIDVPENAPAGGQYATISVSSDTSGDAIDEGIALHAQYAIAHLIYAEVAGETKRGGEINDVSVPGFLFSGKISATANIKNTGNVHSDAIHTIQIFPLFSDEEIYTNEENPDINLIMPNTTRSTSLDWGETPSIGIFHVIYNVEFEGVNQRVDKMVIICPLWLLFIIAVIIFLIIFKILSGKKANK